MRHPRFFLLLAGILLTVATAGSIGAGLGFRLPGSSPLDLRLEYGAIIADSMTPTSRRPVGVWHWVPDPDLIFVPAFRRSGNAMFAALPLWPFAVGAFVASRLLRPRPADARCPKCGYALGGLPSSQCPECGSSHPT